jgi:hypothetical protein
MDRLLDVVAVFSVVMMILVLISVRRAHIRVEYSVSWLGAALILFLISRNGGMLQHVSDMMGISYPPLALLFFILCVFLVVFYRFSIRISEMKDANIALAQRLAILEYQLRSRHEEQSPESNPS